ncbi:ATP-binding protein [Symplocastrum sp. BBK-W-15]|uniref:Circadian input-output histidine kinase CikA n=1 Tax=Limnofasciculus baicalensis BBK-W-15 TaxID=2699891 RepID=A0AAE3KL55_9CYAN|nr:ATP-binding protein [Limnofasciculus baicalensis BBK-W-15]
MEGNYEDQYRYNHPDGTQRWIAFSQSSVRDKAGDCWIVTSVCTDITPRKRAEEAVRQSEAKYRALYESIGVAIIIGNQTNIFTCNKAAEKLFGYSLYEMMGKHASELSPPIQANGEDSFPLANQHIAITFYKGNHQFEWIHRRADGTDFPVEIWLTAVEVGSEKLVQAIIYDLSERKEAEKTLKIAKDAAESANRAKSAFLANMSHELRTPLNAIIGFAQLMDRDIALTPQQREFLAIINRSGEHLLNLINDVLEMSKIEAGRIILNPAPFNLHYLLQTLREMFQIRTKAKKLSLEFDIAPNLPQYIITDEGKLRQVLINLLGNAVKFTQTGGIILRAKSYSTPHSLNFEIEDTGRGIAPFEIDNLFQPFVQANSGIQAREGTGLGLTISRQFVQLMGGDINLTSTPGKGSIFRFNIQITLANPVETAAKVTNKTRIIGLAQDQPEYRILIVDDRQENRDLIAQLLNIVGFQTRTAPDGEIAIAIWQEWHPHLIWMDMRMPIIDGYEATKYIKAKSGERLENSEIHPRHKTVIIALSASAFDEQQTNILAAGCDDFVRKPFQEQVIFEKMAEHLGVKYIHATQPDDTETGQNPQSKIPNLTSADLTVMPTEWIEELHQAATEVDADKITQLIEQIPKTHHTLVTGLTQLLQKFCFDEILELLAPIFPPSPAD